MIIQSRMSRVITLPALIRQHGPFSSQSSHFLPFLRRQGVGMEGESILNFQQFHFVAVGFNIIFNLPCLIANMKLSAVVKQTQDLMEQRAALPAILLHHADIFPRPEAGNVIHSALLRGGGPICQVGRGGHGISVFHHLPIHHNVTQLPACQGSQRAWPGVRGVWIFGALNQEMIPTIHDSWWGLDDILYMLRSRSSILRMKFILPLLRAIHAPVGSVSSAERRPELTFQSSNRSQDAKQYKCLKGGLDSIPFHLFSFTWNLQAVFCVSQRGLDLCGVEATLPYRFV